MPTKQKTKQTPRTRHREPERIYDHVENIEIATKNDIERLNERIDSNTKLLGERINNIKEHVNRTWQVMLAGFGLIMTVTVSGFLWIRSDIKEIKTEINNRIDRVEKEALKEANI